jgi:hypothetical protein
MEVIYVVAGLQTNRRQRDGLAVIIRCGSKIDARLEKLTIRSLPKKVVGGPILLNDHNHVLKIRIELSLRGDCSETGEKEQAFGN